MSSRRGRRIAVPAANETAGTLTNPHYSWAYELTATQADQITAERWARSIFEGAPAALRAFFGFGWKVGLGLKLSPLETAGSVQGWQIRQSGPRHLTLAAQSRIVQAENTVLVDDTTVTWITLVRYNSWLGRAVWALTRPLHQLLVPMLLIRADRRRSPG